MKKVADLQKTLKSGVDPRLSCKLKTAEPRPWTLGRQERRRSIFLKLVQFFFLKLV